MFSSRKFPACLSLCAVLSVSAVLRAADEPKPAEPHFPTTDDLRHLKSMGGPQLSPDGKQVLFLVTDATADGAKSHRRKSRCGNARIAVDEVFIGRRSVRSVPATAGMRYQA